MRSLEVVIGWAACNMARFVKGWVVLDWPLPIPWVEMGHRFSTCVLGAAYVRGYMRSLLRASTVQVFSKAFFYSESCQKPVTAVRIVFFFKPLPGFQILNPGFSLRQWAPACYNAIFI